MRRRTAGVALVLVVAPAIAACGGAEDGGAAREGGATTATTATTFAPSAEVRRLRVEVVAEHPHDPDAFTQGLVYEDGVLYESTGLVGRSSVRIVDLGSGRVVRERANPGTEFGEGLAKVGDRLIQITWRDGVARVHDADTLEPRGEFRYTGEGWGLTHDGTRLIMSDGTSTLTFRDPDTFKVAGVVDVALDRRLVDDLNELEWDPRAGLLWANVWHSTEILGIDPADGRVVAVVDADGIGPDRSLRDPEDVLNGIAVVPGTDRLLLTGKRWPVLYEVRFVPE